MESSEDLGCIVLKIDPFLVGIWFVVEILVLKIHDKNIAVLFLDFIIKNFFYETFLVKKTHLSKIIQKNYQKIWVVV